MLAEQLSERGTGQCADVRGVVEHDVEALGCAFPSDAVQQTGIVLRAAIEAHPLRHLRERVLVQIETHHEAFWEVFLPHEQRAAMEDAELEDLHGLVAQPAEMTLEMLDVSRRPALVRIERTGDLCERSLRGDRVRNCTRYAAVTGDA